MKNEKINTKKTDRNSGILAVLATLVMAVVLGFLAWKSCKVFEETVVGQTQQHLLTIAKTAAIRSEEFIEEHLAVLRVVSRDPSVKEEIYSKLIHDKPDITSCPARSFYETHKNDLDAFAILDANGIMLERYPFIAGRPGMDHTDKPGVSYVIKEHKPHVSDVFVNNLGNPAISVSVPVFDKDRFVGIVRCMIQLDTIYRRFVEPISLGIKGYVQIVNDDGIMTAHPNPEYIGKDIIATRKAAFLDYDWSELENIVSKMTRGQEGVGVYHSVWWDGDEPKFVKKLTAFTPIKLGHELWSVGVTMDYKEVSGPIVTHTRNINMTAGLLILIFSAAGLWIYKVQREKTKLAARAEFAEELRTINQQLTAEITERKQAEELLRESEEKFSKAFRSNVSIMALSTLEDGLFIDVNDEFLRIFGYDRDKIIGKRALDLQLFADIKQRDAMKQIIREKGTVRNFEIMYRTKHGELRHGLFSGEAISLHNRACWLTVMYDITERKHAEQELRTHQYYLEKAQEIGSIGTWQLDVEKNILKWTDEGYSIFGVPAGTELTYESFMECVHPDDREYVNNEWMAGVAGRPYDIEHRIIANGEVKWVREKAELFFNDSDEVVRAVGVTQDITERKHAEAQAHSSSQRLKHLVSSSSTVIYSCKVGENWEATYITDNVEKAWGYKVSDFLKPEFWVSHIHPGDRDRIILGLDALLKNGSHEHEYRFMLADGLYYWINDKTILVYDDNGKPLECVGSCTDITERKRVEQKLEIAKERAEAANIAKGQFLANMSHEIRTPMSVITGFSDILVNEELTKDQLSYAELIRNAGKSLLTIINDILDYSKIEAGKLEVAPADYSPKKILDNVEAIMRPLAVKKDLQFEVIRGERLPAIIQTDEDRLHQCLVNLVSNAIKFTEQGHVHVKVSIEDRGTKPFIRFDIEDTGIGISMDMQENIFDSFVQVEKGSTRQYGGTGLGLTITSQLAGLLGGELSFTSRQSEGSTFSLLIPAGVDVVSEMPLEKERVVSETVPTKEVVHTYSGKVLVAEDDEGCQVLTGRLLKRLGLEVTIADDGEEAIEKALKGPFDLIFMDIRMPHLNGFQATEALRKKGINIPIIALTAHAMEGDRQLCIQAGCDGYLSKPIDCEELYKIIDKYLPARSPGKKNIF